MCCALQSAKLTESVVHALLSECWGSGLSRSCERLVLHRLPLLAQSGGCMDSYQRVLVPQLTGDSKALPCRTHCILQMHLMKGLICV